LARKKEKDPMVLARKALDPLWKKSDLHGRCWGLKKTGNNPYAGTNITIGKGKEIISVSMSKDGSKKPIIHELVKAKNTKLGNRARKILEKKGLLKNSGE
jgi:hypothetical protein